MASSNRKIVVAHAPTSILALIEFVKLVIKKFTGNLLLPNPNPTIAVVTAHVEDLETKELEVGAGGSVEARNASAEIVKIDIRHWVNYVQAVADNNPTNAGAIIENSGFSIKEKGVPAPKGFEVKSTEPGVVELQAPVSPEGCPYTWEVSTDNIHWTFLRVSRLAACTVNNLTSGSVYYIRYFTLDKENNYTAPSQALNVRVN